MPTNRQILTQMPIVFLNDFSAARVPAENLLVRCSADEEMLFILVRIKLDAVRNFTRRETRNAFARLRVPQFAKPGIATRVTY